MNNIELQATIQSNIQDVMAVLDYHFANTIRNIYKTPKALRTDIAKIWKVDKQDGNALTKYKGLFPNIIDKLAQYPHIGNRKVKITKQVIKGISNCYKVVCKVDRKYRSGEEFHRRSYILIQDSHIDEIIKSVPKMDAKDDKLLEIHYTKRQCKLIRKVIFGIKNEEKSEVMNNPTRQEPDYLSEIDMMENDIKPIIIPKIETTKEIKPNDITFVTETNMTDDIKSTDVEIPVITHSAKATSEDDIEWTDVYDQEKRRNTRIWRVYNKLRKMVDAERIPASMANRFSIHFGLGKKMAPTNFCYNGDMKMKAGLDKILDDLIYRIENDIYLKNKAS